MTETRALVACPDCHLFWAAGAEPWCSVSDHQSRHRSFEIHLHRTPVRLPDGTAVIAVSFDATAPYERARQPDFGLYLDERWRPPWPHERLEWPDFGVPGDRAGMISALRALLERARAGERVEIGCFGGHGRTGTALACLAVLTGLAVSDAVAWVRTNYCDKAVETKDQETFVNSLSEG